ncbi:MAG: YnbE family lipoprotein [Phycisphaera sp.]|nr:YnbE family lipoprotein [Phycisphaera sp.]
MLAATPLLLAGCKTEHKIEVEPVEVKPIHITVDVNVRVKVDKELDNFFDFQDTEPVSHDATNGVKATPVEPAKTQ